MKFIRPCLAAIGLLLSITSVASAASPKVLYGAAGSYSANNCENQIDCSPTYEYTGASECTKNCLSGAPAGGTFSFSLLGSGKHPPSPCVSKKLTGTVEVLWADHTTTTASIAGKASKKGGYSLKLTVTGGTNTFYAPGPVTKGFVSHPPSPCSPGSFAGSLTFSH
ncbi:MAG: hypothetical protein QOK19_1387 [Solirubrobacteraceae bacterium]|nr:hypothetical protein [Solirubrobacteraceae bacterium]